MPPTVGRGITPTVTLNYNLRTAKANHIQRRHIGNFEGQMSERGIE